MIREIKMDAVECRCDVCGHSWVSTKFTLAEPPKFCPSNDCPNPPKWNGQLTVGNGQFKKNSDSDDATTMLTDGFRKGFKAGIKDFRRKR